MISIFLVVLDTTKVQIFKQITTGQLRGRGLRLLFQIPQRYRFSSKSQPVMKWSAISTSCFRYHKGTDFQANHNCSDYSKISVYVVLDTTKIQIFKQITTMNMRGSMKKVLFQIPQRYTLFTHIMQKHTDKGVRESSIIIPQTWYFSNNQGVKGMINRSFEALFEINTI